MSHPALGLPPDDPTAGSPDAAARLRDDLGGLALRALEATCALDPSFDQRYGAPAINLFLRDEQRHIEQLARALETGNDRWHPTIRLFPAERKIFPNIRKFTDRLFPSRLPPLRRLQELVAVPASRVARG